MTQSIVKYCLPIMVAYIVYCRNESYGKLWDILCIKTQSSLLVILVFPQIEPQNINYSVYIIWYYLSIKFNIIGGYTLLVILEYFLFY